MFAELQRADFVYVCILSILWSTDYVIRKRGGQPRRDDSYQYIENGKREMFGWMFAYSSNKILTHTHT